MPRYLAALSLLICGGFLAWRLRGREQPQGFAGVRKVMQNYSKRYYARRSARRDGSTPTVSGSEKVL